MFVYKKNLLDRERYPYQHVGVLDQHPIGAEPVLTTANEAYYEGEAVKVSKETGAVTACGAADKPAYIMAEAVTAAANSSAKTLMAYRVLPGNVYEVGVKFSATAAAIAKDSSLQIDTTKSDLVTDVVKSGSAGSEVYGIAKVVDVLDANTNKEDGDKILVTFE
jgi:hypothetical protein